MMNKGEVTVGGTYYTDGGLACEVIAIAGQKVVFRMTLHDGTVRQLDSSLSRFAMTCNLTNPA